MVPGRVGQQEIDPGRPQIHQGLVDRQRVVGHVDRAQQPRIQIGGTGRLPSNPIAAITWS